MGVPNIKLHSVRVPRQQVAQATAYLLGYKHGAENRGSEKLEQFIIEETKTAYALGYAAGQAWREIQWQKAAAALWLLMMFSVCVSAQSQTLTVFEVISGNEVKGFVQEGQGARVYRSMRLAGVETVNASGALTTGLAERSRDALAKLVEGRAVSISPVKFETAWTVANDLDIPSVTRRFSWQTRWVVLMLLLPVKSDDETDQTTGADLAEAQLRNGFVWLRNLWETEIPADEQATYRKAEFAARFAQAGLWSHGWAFHNPVPERTDKPGKQLPTRRN